MAGRDEVAATNERFWNREVEKGCGFTIPWLDLEAEMLRRYAAGTLERVPEALTEVCPRDILLDVAGKDVLCLACGGGQQSAVFGLLGARVTVLELAEGQLEGDRRAAAHYGYDISAVHGDMRDLSAFSGGSFDLVYGTAVCYVPDVREVYRGVARVLRPGGLYRSDWYQPSLHFLEWDGGGYRVAKPYVERVDRREDGAIEFRHYMDDIFNGLTENGMAIQQVEDTSRDVVPTPDAPPGTWRYETTYFGGRFVIVARRQPDGQASTRGQER